jgi:hypothetical protein
MLVNFITLKWGAKYGPEYVNRLYRAIVNTYSGEFIFHCITDNPIGFDDGITIIKMNSVIPSTKVFSMQKMFMFNELFPIKGNKCILDLDILIHNDLYSYLKKYNFKEPRFIEPIWQNKEHVYKTYHHASCMVNSSFVTWKDDQLDYLYQFYIKHKEKIEFKYNSFDRFIFYNFYDVLKFHPKKIAYSYSFGATYPDDLECEIYRNNYLMSLYLTSHGTGTELHDANGWVKEFWCQYDS